LPLHSRSQRVWYRSLYWRIAIGFIAFLAVLLVTQALLFVWLTGRTAGAFPAASNSRLADLSASDVRDQLESDPNVDLAAHISDEYGRVAQPFLVLMIDGRYFSNQQVIPPALMRTARNRLNRLALLRPFVRPPRIQQPAVDGGRVDTPIVVNGEVLGLVSVPAGRAAPMAALRTLGPTLAASGLALLLVGAGAAALLIFGPVRRRLGQLEDAARRIGAGDIAARAPEHGGDEVAALAKSFNRMAEDLQTRAQALEASDKARRQLLADVSHELMTPLTAMRGYLETLEMAELRLDPPTRERYLRIVDDETQRLERIIGDLLDLARLEGGDPNFRREFVDINALFERVAARHERELDERGVRLSRNVDAAATRVLGDPNRLEQVLQNLAANALRHTPTGGEIALRAAAADSRIRITVKDTGPGIDPAHLPLIFDRFHKVDAARTAAGGSGLGLSIVKAIVERHGGTIHAANDPQGGAVFVIDLPAERR
jgi:two-component system sensor histidine kinase BaeS